MPRLIGTCMRGSLAVHAVRGRALWSMAFNDAAQQFLDAASAGNAEAMRSALAEMQPDIERVVLSAARRRHRLLQQAKLDEYDVVQHVIQRLLERPPTNRGAHVPAAVITSWVRCVASNFLLDQGTRGCSEEIDQDVPVSVSVMPSPEELTHISSMAARTRQCADTYLVQFKYLREVYLALLEDPDLSARELAVKLGIASESELRNDAQLCKRAETHAWQLRFRALSRLAECLGVHRDVSKSDGRKAR